MFIRIQIKTLCIYYEHYYVTFLFIMLLFFSLDAIKTDSFVPSGHKRINTFLEGGVNWSHCCISVATTSSVGRGGGEQFTRIV